MSTLSASCQRAIRAGRQLVGHGGRDLAFVEELLHSRVGPARSTLRLLMKKMSSPVELDLVETYDEY